MRIINVHCFTYHGIVAHVYALGSIGVIISSDIIVVAYCNIDRLPVLRTRGTAFVHGLN